MHHSRRATQKKAHSKKDAADRCAESCMLPWPWAVMIMGAWELAGSSQPNWKLLKPKASAIYRPPLHSSAVQMSRRAPIVEEFDDDTDLPLPSRSLPNTGSRGAILEEIANSDDDGDGGDSDEAPELLDPSAVGGPALQPSVRDTRVTDITPYKKCAQKTCPHLKHDRPFCPAHLSFLVP